MKLILALITFLTALPSEGASPDIRYAQCIQRQIKSSSSTTPFRLIALIEAQDKCIHVRSTSNVILGPRNIRAPHEITFFINNIEIKVIRDEPFAVPNQETCDFHKALLDEVIFQNPQLCQNNPGLQCPGHMKLVANKCVTKCLSNEVYAAKNRFLDYWSVDSMVSDDYDQFCVPCRALKVTQDDPGAYIAKTETNQCVAPHRTVLPQDHREGFVSKKQNCELCYANHSKLQAMENLVTQINGIGDISPEEIYLVLENWRNKFLQAAQEGVSQCRKGIEVSTHYCFTPPFLLDFGKAFKHRLTDQDLEALRQLSKQTKL